MAQLKDLLVNIPTEVLQEQKRHDREQVMREVARRKALSYARRLEELNQVFHPFDACRQTRPSKRKVQNRYSREEAGTKGMITMGIRTGKYGVVVCKVQNKW